MADLPELSDSTKRKLALQWSTLLDTNHLTGEHFQWHERERERLRRIAAQSPGPGRDWRNERGAADETGLHPSVTVAEARFKDLSGEYWRRWLNSGGGYEVFVGWLEVLKRQVCSEVASVWKGKSTPVDRWYERACGPAVEKALAVLVKKGTNRARAEVKRLESGAQPKDDSRQGAEAIPSIIGKLPKDALVRMDAATAVFMAEYWPKLEREANKRGPLFDAELLRELVIHQFNLVGRELMAVCTSVEEFEAELHSDIARLVRYGLSQYPWLADPMLKELDTGFAFFVMCANPWADIPDSDRASVWHVGATTGEALSHAALKLRAEAWTRAAAGGFPKPTQVGATETSGDKTSQTDGGPADNETNGKQAAPMPQFPKRASWLKDKLRERSWNKHDLSRQGGPDHKTVQKILDGFSVREDVLQKVADGLSKRQGKVNLPDIPPD